MTKSEAQARVTELSAELDKHNRLYYLDALPEVSDADYDALMNELKALESKFPDKQSSDNAKLRTHQTAQFHHYKKDKLHRPPSQSYKAQNYLAASPGSPSPPPE